MSNCLLIIECLIDLIFTRKSSVLKMYKFDEKLEIEYLPFSIYKQLVNELEKFSNWIQLAERVAELGCLGSSWVTSLENNPYNGGKKLPSENLLDELNIRMCNVEVLCDLLKDCNLLGALSLLHQPEPLIIIKQPNDNASDVNIALGKKLRIKCEAKGLPPPSYIWHHENLVLDEQNNNELIIEINNLKQEGEYKCLILQIDCDGNVIDEKMTESINVIIKPIPITIKLEPSLFLEIKKNHKLELLCEVNSHPAPIYQWYRDNTKLDMQTTNKLLIENFNENDEGKYYCHIKNKISEIFTKKSNVIIEHPREKAVAKIALLIANEDYENHDKLKTPKNDVIKLSKLLTDMNFNVICLYNLTTKQTKNSMKIFSSLLNEGVYGLFYFAGHGFKMQESYVLGIDSPKLYLRCDAICESELLAMILPRDPSLLVTILDTCQTVPPKQINPNIYNEIPTVNEYKGIKNLRNLIQAYSTSSYKPSYERNSTDTSLYITHLCKYITKDIPVQKLFEQVGKSIDTWFKGKERNQIPMFALTVTKPYRLTDAIYPGTLPKSILKFNELIKSQENIIDIHFQPCGIHGQIKINQYSKPFLNSIKVQVNLDNHDHFKINLYNFIPNERNNLFCSPKNGEFRVHNPQTSSGPLVISIEKNSTPIGAVKFDIMKHVPAMLHYL